MLRCIEHCSTMGTKYLILMAAVNVKPSIVKPTYVVPSFYTMCRGITNSASLKLYCIVVESCGYLNSD